MFEANERPRLKLLALRYGVAVEDILAANGLPGPSLPVDNLPYIYIPPRRRTATDIDHATRPTGRPHLRRAIESAMGS